MRRTCIETRVSDVDEATRFYSAIFGRQPTLSSPGHVRWSIDDSGIEFAISARAAGPPLDSAGFS